VPKDISARAAKSGHPAALVVGEHPAGRNARTTRRERGLRSLGPECPTGGTTQSRFYVGVALSNLVPDHLHTLIVAGLEKKHARRTNRAATMDSINKKHGKTHDSSTHDCCPRALRRRRRIAVTSIPDLV